MLEILGLVFLFLIVMYVRAEMKNMAKKSVEKVSKKR